MGWGMSTFLELAHARDATLYYVLFNVHIYEMLWHAAVVCTPFTLRSKAMVCYDTVARVHCRPSPLPFLGMLFLFVEDLLYLTWVCLGMV